MEMGGHGGVAPPDRAFQARYVRRGHRCFPGIGQSVSARKKPPVLMIHGAFAGPFVWEGFAAKFRDVGYEVHAPMLRHHDSGNSSETLGRTSLADYADDLGALIETLPVPPIVLGHAMGGLLAQILAARTKVHALILLAPSAPW